MEPSPRDQREPLTTRDRSAVPSRPHPTTLQPRTSEAAVSTTSLQPADMDSQYPRKKRHNHRGGAKKKRARKQSFAISTEDDAGMPGTSHGDSAVRNAARSSFYRVQGGNLSDASIDSEALLDHR